MAILGPFDVDYPVNFYSGGDTTKDAFGKHIQEIKRIYGIINALDSDKISASEFNSAVTNIENKINTVKNESSNLYNTLSNSLTQHINSSNPHPNLKIDLGTQTTGYLSSSKISDFYSRVSDLINSATNPTYQINPDKGYYRFSKILMIQWGIVGISADYGEIARHVYFQNEFASTCFNVSLTYYNNSNQATDNHDFVPQLLGMSKDGFRYQFQDVRGDGYAQWDNTLGIQYIAIGD